MVNKQFTFPKGPDVKRNVTIEGDATWSVTAKTLPVVPKGTSPKAGKGMVKLIQTVIEPEVCDVTGVRIHSLSSPLTITVDYEESDAIAAVGADEDGKPLLSIATFRQDDRGVWHWKRWDTEIIASPPYTRGQLRADVTELAPNDPFAEVSP